MHVAPAALANLNEIATKRQFLDWLFERLERAEKGPSLIRAIANELAAQTRFPDLEGWEDSEVKKNYARGSVAALREWLDQEAESQENEKLTEGLPMGKRSEPAESIPLVPLSDFNKIAAKVFTTSKAESDRQLQAFQKANPHAHAKQSKAKGKRR